MSITTCYFKLWKVLKHTQCLPLHNFARTVKIGFPSNCSYNERRSDECAVWQEMIKPLPQTYQLRQNVCECNKHWGSGSYRVCVRSQFNSEWEGYYGDGEKNVILHWCSSRPFYHRRGISCFWRSLSYAESPLFLTKVFANMHSWPHWTRNIIMNSKHRGIHDQWKGCHCLLHDKAAEKFWPASLRRQRYSYNLSADHPPGASRTDTLGIIYPEALLRLSHRRLHHWSQLCDFDALLSKPFFWD